MIIFRANFLFIKKFNILNIFRTWEEGKIMVFDDSFEHEVWHNGTDIRLILIIDVWHPDLTPDQKKTLVPI